MRKRRAGHILNITSMGGIITLPGLSYYHGSKFALEGISESLGKEIKPLESTSPRSNRAASAPIGPDARWCARPESIPDYDAMIEPTASHGSN